MRDIKVISVGGSIIAPETLDIDFLRAFRTTITDYLKNDSDRKLILVCGGGSPARTYQRAFREITAELSERKERSEFDQAQDWIGIAATRLNAELIKHLFWEYCPVQVITDPSSISLFHGRVLLAAGWKPGRSTDYVAVLLAEKFQADTLINLSNIPKVYSADPKKNADAKPIDRISWKKFGELVGDAWIPGKNVPFDPVATEYAAKIHIEVIVAAGRDLENLNRILTDSSFEGTVIGPD